MKDERKNAMCVECYSENKRITPLLNAQDCLQNHTQYICGTCGRCICIEHDPKRGVQRWNFPFKTLELAKLYLRSADHTVKKPCGIYEIESKSGRLAYKIFAEKGSLEMYLAKNKDKSCRKMSPVFSAEEYTQYPNTQVRRLNADEVEQYLIEKREKHVKAEGFD